MKAEAKERFEFVGWKEKGQTEYVSKDAEYQFKVTKNIELTGEFKAVEVPHIPSAQEILDDILANHKIPSEVKAGTETLVLPEAVSYTHLDVYKRQVEATKIQYRRSLTRESGKQQLRMR